MNLLTTEEADRKFETMFERLRTILNPSLQKPVEMDELEAHFNISRNTFKRWMKDFADGENRFPAMIAPNGTCQRFYLSEVSAWMKIHKIKFISKEKKTIAVNSIN